MVAEFFRMEREEFRMVLPFVLHEDRIGENLFHGGYEKATARPLFEFRKRKKVAFYWDQRKRGLSRMPFVNIPQLRYIAVFRHSWLCFFSAVLVA